MKKNYSKRHESRNKFSFVGYIVEVNQTRVFYKNGRQFVSRTIIVADIDEDGNQYDMILMNVPYSFEMSLLNRLKNKKEEVHIDFDIYPGKGSAGSLNYVNVTRIIPTDPIKAKMERVRDPKADKIRNLKIRVDKDGYKYPYNY